MTSAIGNKLYLQDSLQIYDQFSTLLSDSNYLEAVKVAEYCLKVDPYNIALKILRQDVIDHFEKNPLVSEEYFPLLDVLVEPDTKEKAYGLNVDWINVNVSWFQAILKRYINALEKRGLTLLECSQKLSWELKGFRTYPKFSPEQAQILMDVTPEAANLPPDLDYSEFCGIAELKENKSTLPFTSGTLLLDTPSKIYQFIGKNPVLEGDELFFKNEVKFWMDKHFPLEEALQGIRTSYQKAILAFEAVKSLLDNIKVYATNDLQLDTSISEGHENIGLIQFNGRQVVCKFVSSIPKNGTNGFEIIQNLFDFVRKSIQLHEAVPNVVKILPYTILNKTENVDVGYLMEIEPGDQLRKISKLSLNEKQIIQNQFNKAVGDMFNFGYALYDFEEDNVLWDGKKLTFIDLSPAGFKPEALKNADIMHVIDRMSKMLAKKVI